MLGIVAEAHSDRKADLEEVAAAVRSKVTSSIGITPEVIALIPRRTLPKTPSGKVCRNATLQAFLDGSLAAYAVFDTQSPGQGGRRPVAGRPGAMDIQLGPTVSSGKIEKEAEVDEKDSARRQRAALARISSEDRERALLGLVTEAIRQVKPSAADFIQPDEPLDRLGLDSIHVVELLAELEERSGVILPMEELAHGATVRVLIRTISAELDRDRAGEAASV